MINEKAIQLIKKSNPDLIIKDLKFIKSGFHSLGVLVNDSFIFRFPLEKEFFEEYIKEQKLLNVIHNKISTKLPILTLYSIDGEIFTKHKLIKGEQYSSIGQNLNKKEKDILADDLAKFLAELHNIKTNIIEISQFSPNDYEILEHKYILYNYLKNNENIDQFNNVLHDFEIESKKLSKNNIVLCHNDLNENNILIDTETKRLAGIIDFGNAVKRDFSSDFASLLKYDYDLTLNIINKYQKLTNRIVNLKYVTLIQKIRCYGGILWAILENNDNSKIKIYQDWLKRL